MALVKFCRCCNFYLLSNILGGVFLGILSIQFISLLSDLTFLIAFLGILFIKMILVLVTIATNFVLLLFLLVAFSCSLIFVKVSSGKFV